MIKNNLLLSAAVFLLFLPLTEASALDLSRYESVTPIKVEGIVTPKVARFATSEVYDHKTVLVNEVGDSIAHTWIRKTEKVKGTDVAIEEVSSTFKGHKTNLTDGDRSTSLAFDPLDKSQPSMILTFPELTEVSGVSVAIDEGIIAPLFVSVYGDFGNGEWVPLISLQSFAYHLPFPKVDVKRLQIEYTTRHFLRINEVSVSGQDVAERKDELVFYAEEGAEYSLYSDAKFGYKRHTPQALQRLNTSDRTPLFSLGTKTFNQSFDDDFDNDGLSDFDDFCPKVADSTNADIDGNGLGDVCEDPDQDNKISSKDNCPYVSNPDQKDSDADGTGDLCDKTDDRVSEHSDYLIYVIFGLAALMLIWLIFRSAKK